MTLKEKYINTGSNYDETIGRLGSEAFLQRLIGKFKEDNNMDLLDKALLAKDAEAAFRAAHTLKGIALNLGFTKLAKSSSDLTELLRGKSSVPEGFAPLLDAVKADYKELITSFID